MKELIPKFKEAIFSKIENLGQDYIELGIDTVMKEGILKEIPIIKSISSSKNIITTIYERNLLKNLCVFIMELNSGSRDEIKIKEYQYKINHNEKLAEKELGRILILLDQYIDNEKAIILARLFKAFINERISWDEFCEFSEITNRIFIQDIKILDKIRNKEINNVRDMKEKFRMDRLYALGLIEIGFKSLTYNDIKEGNVNTKRKISEQGIKFCENIFK